MEAESSPPAQSPATPPPAPQPSPPLNRIALLRDARARAEATLGRCRAELAEVDAAILNASEELKKLEAAETVEAVKDLLAAENARRTLRMLREKDRPASVRAVVAAESTVRATQRDIDQFEFKAAVRSITALVTDIENDALTFEDATRAKIAALTRLIAGAEQLAQRCGERFEASWTGGHPGYPWLGHVNLPPAFKPPYRQRAGEMRQFFEWMANVAFRSPRLGKKT